MNSQFRHWLFRSFVLVFIIMAVLIVPYALGYKYTGTGVKLQKTGMFVIDTEPSGAKIYLNNKLQTSNIKIFKSEQNKALRTPIKLSHQNPGTYKVRLELDGYWPWDKELTINPSETTYLEDVRFFKRNLPQIFNRENEIVKNSSVLSSDKRYLAYLSSDKIVKLDLNNGSNQTYEKKTGDLKWSARSNYLANGFSIINIKNNSIIDLEKVAIQNITGLQWSVDTDNLLCLITNQGVYSYDLNNQKLTAIDVFNNPKIVATDCMLKSGYAQILKNYNSKSILTIIKSDQNQKIGEIELVRQANYNFTNRDNSSINIIDSNSQKLTIIKTRFPWSNNYDIDNLPSNIKLSQWMNSSSIITASDYEIAIYNIDDNSEKLLTRVSSEIQNIFWHPSKNYIIYITNEGVYALELDNRDRYNITRLAELSNISDAHLDQSGDNLYFQGQIGQMGGVLKLEL